MIMKSKKAEMSVGIMLLVIIAVIFGLVIFQQIASNVDQGTRANSGTVTASNTLITGVLDTNVELTGQELVSVTSVTNRTGAEDVSSTNYTISECVRASDGLKGICYKATGVGIPPATGPLNVSYVYYPDGYIDNQGGRAIFGLIVIFAAIAIILVILAPIIKDKFGTD